jgi:hypothetical protein
LNAAIQRRTLVCLAKPEWLHIPFLGSPKTDLDKLHDLAFKIPALLARISEIIQQERCPPPSGNDRDANRLDEPCTSPAGALELASEYEMSLSSMEKWLEDFAQRHPSPLYWSMKTPFSCPSPFIEVDPQCIPKFTNAPYRLRFPNSQIAGVLASFWSYQLDLLLGLIELERSLVAHGFNMTKKLDIHQSDARERACSILDTLPYLTSCFEGSLRLQGLIKTVDRYFSVIEHEL